MSLPTSIDWRVVSYFVQHPHGGIGTSSNARAWLRGDGRLVGIISNHVAKPAPGVTREVAVGVMYLARALIGGPFVGIARNDARVRGAAWVKPIARLRVVTGGRK